MLKHIDICDIPKNAKKSRNSEIMNDIEEFIKSGESAAEVVVPKKSSTNSVCASYRNAIRAKSYPVKAIKRSEKVFLIRQSKGPDAH